MSMLSIWPMLTLVGLAVAFLSLCPFRFLDSAPTVHTHRIGSLDGIRGFLAVAVAFHHFVLGTYGAKLGHSAIGASHFYTYLGPAGVTVFFMITGYLFWDRLLSKGHAINWLDLYVNRFFRISPLYLALMMAYFILAFVLPGAVAQTPAATASQTTQWLALGVVKNPPAFLGNAGAMNAVGQTWSLRYEWLFYACLPLLSIFARDRSALAISVAALFLVLTTGVMDESYRWFVAEFLCGMLAASLLRNYPDLRGDGASKSLLAAALVLAAFRFTDTPYSFLATVLLGGFFLLVASGASLFGLLRLPGAIRMGNMSYSIYLLHGLMIVVVMTRPNVMAYAIANATRFWIVGGAVFAIVIATSIASFAVIERGGIQLGRRLGVTRRSRAGTQGG